MVFNRVTRGRALTGAINVGGGTSIKKIQSGSVAVDFPSTTANNTSSATFTITGLAAGDVLVLNTASTIGVEEGSASAFALSNVAALSANTGVAYGMAGSVVVNPASVAFTYLWFDLT